MGSHLIIKLYRLFTIQFLKLLVSIVVVVSPLVNLMKDQVDKLANLGILATSLSEITEENAKGVVEGKISIVHGSPEAWNSELKSVDATRLLHRLLQFANKFVIKPSNLSSAK